MAKTAKADLEKAIEIDDQALNGSAYTTLGTLYYKVPGWPLGFGDKASAETLLKNALRLNPQGIDSNYFYALFLLDKKQYEQAESYLLFAKKAAPRADRPLADKGRLMEIDKALAEVKKYMNDQAHANTVN
jgi:Tfp pilus assembly protein PilF